MKKFFAYIKKRERRAMMLAVVILLQAICAIFFIGDVIIDLFQNGHLDMVHMTLEVFAAVALLAGVIYLMYELRNLLERMDAMDVGIRAAGGEMAILVEAFFDKWQLTSSEREIAFYILKGIDNEAIAKMRGTAQSTVRAQCAQIYKKSEVDGRAQLLSVFMEELFHAGEANE